MKKFILSYFLIGMLALILIHCSPKQQNSRTIQNFGKDWKFQLGDVSGAENSSFDDSGWRTLNVPHDWSIEGEFSKENPASPGGGALPGGIDWYRKSSKVSAEDLTRSVFIDFDGGELDLIGYNYHHQDFASFPETFPGQKFIGAETVSALMTRGVYDMPSEEICRWPVRDGWKGPKPSTDNTCSSYDNVSAPWGSTHEETWKVIKKHNYLSGQFIWTGFDYLGEPTSGMIVALTMVILSVMNHLKLRNEKHFMENVW